MHMKESNKLWVAIDGVDAVGKSTQIAHVLNILECKGYSVLTLDEFSDSAVGKLISDNIARRQFFSLSDVVKTTRSETALLVADMLYKSESLEGQKFDIALSDRGLISIHAYQAARLCKFHGYELGHATTWTGNFINSAFDNTSILTPTINIILTLSIRTIVERCLDRGEPLTTKDIDFLDFTQNLLYDLSHSRKDVIVISVDGLSREQLSQLIYDDISHLCNP